MNPSPHSAATIAMSTAVRYGLTYLNTSRWSGVLFSQPRRCIALVMGAVMAMIMLGFMTRVHDNRRVNTGIDLGSALVFALSLWLVRSQATHGDVAWMKATIRHHSIAILTSERARLSDPRVRDLASRITEAWRGEIDEMKGLIRDLEIQR